MKTSRRKHLHEINREEIKSIAWKQITESGPAALSLGAIAREMSLSTPALYRYFSSRDDLLAALTADAYSSFTEALDSARDSIPPDDHGGRFRALCLAYHTWAITHPQQYILIFGTPVPGFKMNASVSQVADRSFLIVLEVIHAADQAGRIGLSLQRITLPPELKAQFEGVQHQGESYSAKVMYVALISWSFIHGITSLELCQRYSVILADKIEDFFQLEVDRFMQTIGLE